MLTQKQNEIIDQIKQEFESHNELINSRSQTSSILNLGSIISDIQERDDLIEEQMAINIANYKVIETKVREEVHVLNRELEVLGFYAVLESRYHARGDVSQWTLAISKKCAELNAEKRFMHIYLNIGRDYLKFKGKRIDDIYQILTNYRWSYSNYSSEDLMSLMKNETVREHLANYWERFNKK